VIVSSLGSASSRLLHTCLAGPILIVAFGILTQAKRAAVDLDVLTVMVAVLGRAAANQTSRLRDHLASLLVSCPQRLGPVGVVLSSVLATTTLIQLITNSTAALIFPIAMSSPANLGVSVWLGNRMKERLHLKGLGLPSPAGTRGEQLVVTTRITAFFLTPRHPINTLPYARNSTTSRLTLALERH